MNDYKNLTAEELLKVLGLTNVSGMITENLIVSYGGEDDNNIFLNVSKKREPIWCPNCSSRMYSKGIYKRSLRHPTLQHGKCLRIILSQRKYKCTSKECNYYLNEDFNFVEKGKQITTVVPYLILNKMKDITLTCAAVSRDFDVSDTYVHNIIMNYLDFDRLPLSEIISIDEVFLNIERDARYCVIITDFLTGDIIDVLPNRYEETLHNFFLSYSKEERDKVKYVISDAYDAYLRIPNKYLHNARSVIDSFHIAQFIEKAIRNYINKVKKKYRIIQDKERREKNLYTNKSYKTMKDSKELVLLKKHDWAILCKPGNEPTFNNNFNRTLGIYPTVERIRAMFMELDPNFPIFKELKDRYLDFNEIYIGSPEEAVEPLKELIKDYRRSKYKIFKEFADLLEKHFNEIILSFKVVKVTNKNEEFYRRLSNGPMEGFNRKPKDMKRAARGFSSFPFVRNRLLWSHRLDAAILAIPKNYYKL